METEVQYLDELDEAPPLEASEAPYDFAFNDFLKREFRFGIPHDRPVCKAFVQGHCPLGNSCPDKHYTTPSFQRYVLVLFPKLMSP
jgi:cleavage and polyadenylation specificity factor subunit 4